MSLKDRFENHSDTPAEQPQPEEQKSVELYDTAGHSRNICFVQESGVMIFLNYAYLISGIFYPDTSTINLGFTTSIVEIRGGNLNDLYLSLLSHEVRFIKETNKRYKSFMNAEDVFIDTIAINDKENQ